MARELTEKDREKLREAVSRDDETLRFPDKGEEGWRPAHHERHTIRVCDLTCPYRQNGGAGCWDFRHGNAVHGGPCIPDMRKVESWRKAYEGGDGKRIRRDAGRLMGSLYVQAQRMLEQIDREGLTLEAPRCDLKGNPILFERPDGVIDYVMEVRAHPLLEPLSRVVKLMGISLDDFGLTPKREEGGRLEGRVTVNNRQDIVVIIAEEKQRIEDFKKSLERSLQLRAADPVFQQFAKGQTE